MLAVLMVACALPVRRRHLRARAHQWVQSARWAGAGPRLANS
jgi:hypothetical protein